MTAQANPTSAMIQPVPESRLCSWERMPFGLLSAPISYPPASLQRMCLRLLGCKRIPTTKLSIGTRFGPMTSTVQQISIRLLLS